MTREKINAHAHCFTIDHVPEKFFDHLIFGKTFLHISKIRGSVVLQELIKIGTSGPVRWIVGLFSTNMAKQLHRLHGLIKYGIKDKQDDLIDIINNCYNNDHSFVMLTMDMDQMDAGDASKPYLHQLEEIKKLKSSPKYTEVLNPFVFADPRRKDVYPLVKSHLEDQEAPFGGIKIYPALGYFPFDKALLEIYKYACEKEVPIITHCIIGDVYNRDENYWQNYPTHPISGQTTTPTTNKLFNSSKYKAPEWFQYNFTHPLNFECLLNPVLASKYFGEQVDLSKLKICIGHFGGETEWGMNKKQQKFKTQDKDKIFWSDALNINQKWLGDSNERLNWLTIVQALIKKYPNVYADISFTLHDEKIYGTLKEMLQDQELKDRILFGSDYYVTATEMEEPEIITLIKSKLTDAEYNQIAIVNTKRFLETKVN